VTGDLGAEDFPAFFRQLHGTDGECGPSPFPWQQRLVAQIAETGVWPSLLDLPTGSGKTAALDAAVFLLALRGDQPRRIVFVVDRRIVVHQAAQRARHVARQLSQASTGVLAEVAQRLRAIAATMGDGEQPLRYAELRGGIVRDESWARRPDVPTVLVSTVDQVGSRLLFRGYGVSDAMRPVHAGLLGNDVLYLLDEVHLARPFAQSLAAITHRYRPPEQSHLPDRWSVVELSATPGEQHPDQPFRLDDEDRDAAAAPVLARRLAASKPARTELVKVTGSNAARHREALATAAAGHVGQLLEQPGIRTLGVVVNRVDTAGRVRRQLETEHPDVDCLVLTGRMRPLDRDRILAEHEGRLTTGRRRSDEDHPLVVVATQAIEAGADLDLDALVTECAALDALVQRFGRVDRAGDLAASSRQTTSVILATTADVGDKAEDPVYGTALRDTWSWLQGRQLDFGLDAFTVTAAERNALSTQPEPAPQLLPSHLDRWVQTSATPDADPDPAHWLHGLRAGRAEVTVVWRADLLERAFEGDPDETRDRLRTLVSWCPPGSGEAIQLPVTAVRAWLAGIKTSEATSFADTVGTSDADYWIDTESCAPALDWRGDDSRLVVTADDVHPGATIVVPASYGGISDGCWDPDTREPVTDLAVEMQARQRGRALLRLYPDLDAANGGPPQPAEPSEFDDPVADRQAVQGWLDQFGEHVRDTIVGEVVDLLRTQLRERPDRVELTRVEIEPGETPRRMFVLRSKRRAWSGTADAAVGSEPATSSFLGVPVPLSEHLSDVQRWCRELAADVGLPSTLADDVALAGSLHDLGKGDPRFQLLLRAGEVAEVGDDLLAKSRTSQSDYRKRRRAAEASGYPRRARHELASVALAQHDEKLRATAHDWDLVLHLVASHHGYARPFVPVSTDDRPVELQVPWDGRILTASSDHGLLRLDSGVPQRFWRGVRNYGWYGLAWLEAILRLADHRASEEAEQSS
jgi:CRISPR-associated endonuclease/helicase Cas3